MNRMEIIVPRASWSDAFSDDTENPFILGIPRSKRFRKEPAKMHLPCSSLLSKEWGEVQLAESLNVSENIIFCGSQPRQDMPKFFNLAKFAVLPSRAEAVSLAGLEAMACDLPVIGSNVGGIPQFVYPNKTGYLFPVENHELLAEQIIHGLLLDDNAYKFLSSSATEFVKSNFSWDIAAIKTIEGYYKILGICGHRPPPSP